MNKFLTFLATGFIAILGVFSVSSNTKNAAEPQYFLENKEIHNAAVNNSTETTNIIDFYFDSKTNLYNDTEVYNLLTLNENTEIYYYNENDTLVNINYNYPNKDDMLDFLSSSFSVWEGVYTNTLSTINIQFAKYNTNINEDVIKIEKDQWYAVTQELGFVKIKGIRIINFEYYENENINTINTIVSPYIGNLTKLEQPQTPTNSLNQIGNIISDTIDWFVNIFNGLSNVFYNNGTLSVWGNVLFIGVAIYLVSMCLVWVISLIKGV